MYAAIDIGTNTVLLSVADYRQNRLDIKLEVQRIPRLGKGVDLSGNLQLVRIDQVTEIIIEYYKLVQNNFPDLSGIMITATSAVRDAANRDLLIEKVKRNTGLSITVLTGREEAELMYEGAVSTLPNHLGDEIAVIDIGGGSTEIAIGSKNALSHAHSINIGCVRLTERFFKKDPPGKQEIEQCKNYIRKQIGMEPNLSGNELLIIGIAGTATSLAYMDQKKKGSEPVTNSINGYEISLPVLLKWIDEIGKCSSEKLKRDFPEVMEGRADVFFAGLLIMVEMLSSFSGESLTVSTGGIRHGAILQMAKNEKGAG